MTPETPPQVAAAAADPRNRFGRYVLLRLLGRGGAGVVRVAWDTQVGRAVAIKFIASPDDAQRRDLLREAQLAARLEHPHIVPVYEVGETPDASYIVMKYVVGARIDEAPIGLREKVAAIRDVAAALHYAHANGVVHRDVKPGNILHETSSMSAYLMDFGLARRLNLRSGIPSTTVLAGTPPYMAPEQARGHDEDVDGRTDVYALGATLYTLLTRAPPFSGNDPLAVLERVVQERPAPPRRKNPQIPVDLETVVLKCLEKERGRRYRTAQALSEDLDRWLSGEPVHARRAGLPARAWQRVAQRPATAAIVFLALAGAAASSVIVLPNLRRERELRRGAEERHTALLQLSRLWNRLALAEQGWYRPQSDPADVRARLADALVEIDAFVAAHADLSQAYYVRARGRLSVGSPEAAETDLARALELDPSFTPAWRLLGCVRLEQHLRLTVSPGNKPTRRRGELMLRKLREVEEALRLGRAAGPDAARWGLPWFEDDAILQTLVEAFAALHLDRDTPRARATLERVRDRSAVACHWFGVLAADRDEKIRWQTEALRLMPHCVNALLSRGVARAESGDLPGALEDYSRAIAVNPDSAVAFYNRGYVRGLAQDFTGAEADYTEAVRLDPQLSEGWTNRGAMRQLRGDSAGALEDFAAALRIEPLPVAHQNAARCKIQLGDCAGAVESADAAIALDSTDPRSFQHRANARRKLGDLKHALADLDHAIALGGDASVYGDRAFCRGLMGDGRGARDDIERAVHLAQPGDPVRAAVLAMRGMLRAEEGNLDGALADADEAVRLNARHLPALVVRMNTLIKLGHLDAAAADADAALALHPSAPAYKARGLLRELQAERDRSSARAFLRGAQADLEKAIELGGPGWPERRDALGVVERIRAKRAALGD